MLRNVKKLAGEAFIRALEGETHSSIAESFGLSASRVHQMCAEPWIAITEYCLTNGIQVPKGPSMSHWRRHKQFWLRHFESAWDQELGPKIKNNRKSWPVYCDTERTNAEKELHMGDGFIDVEQYDFIYQTSYKSNFKD